MYSITNEDNGEAFGIPGNFPDDPLVKLTEIN